MRLPTISRDYWSLASGEERHREASTTFAIPSLAERSAIQRGQGAKLIFEIEGEEEDGTVSVSTERMWVIVARSANDFYIGILDNVPATIPRDGEFYLCRGAEVPFRAEHVIAIDTPPLEYAAEVLATQPVHRWAPSEA